MKKITPKVISKKTKTSLKKTSATPKKAAATKGKVVAFRPPSKPKEEEKTARAPKPHPFAHFMKQSFMGSSYRVQTQKLGSRGVYRKKAV